MTDAIRIFISGSCAGLAEVRQALSSHDAIKVVGTAVDAPSAGDRLREETVNVLLHGSSRGDRLPTRDIHTLQSASAAPIVIVTSGCTPEFLQEALAHGVQDVVILPQLTESLVFTLRRAHVLNHNAARPQQPSATVARAGGEGRVITVFSTKGGIGKSTISTGLAGASAGPLKRSTLLVDLDLQFGDVGIVLGLDPSQTLVDLVAAADELDADKLRGYVLRHYTGVVILAAPLRPEDGELVTRGLRIVQMVNVAKSAYAIVVSTRPASMRRRSRRSTAATSWCSSRPGRADGEEHPARPPDARAAGVPHRARRAGAQPASPARLCAKPTCRRTMDKQIRSSSPGDEEVGTAVNRGVPVTTSRSRSPARGNQGDRRAGAARRDERRDGRLRLPGGVAGQACHGTASQPVQGGQVQALQPKATTAAAALRLQGRFHDASGNGQLPSRGSARRPDGRPPIDHYAELKARVHLTSSRSSARACSTAATTGATPASSRACSTPSPRPSLSTGRRCRAERVRVQQEIADDILGYGPLEPFLRDDSGHRDHGQRRRGRLHRARQGGSEHERRFTDDQPRAADHRPDRLAGRPARRRGLADGRRAPPDGSRVNAIIPPLSLAARR